MIKYNIKICFAIIYVYVSNLGLSTQRYEKLLPDLEVVIDLRFSDNYKFGGNNFFFSEFNNSVL